MHHHMYHMHRCGRATSRLLWFLIGAGTASWWHYHKGYAGWYDARYCGRDRIPRTAYYPPPAQPPVDSDAPMPGTVDKWDRWGWGHWGKGSWSGQDNNNPWGWSRDRGAPSAPAQPKPEGAYDPMSPPPPLPLPFPLPHERAPEKDVMQQATDTITELSEATLNNLLVTVESLKAKLAEHRVQREQQDRELQAIREAKFKQFEEWQRQQEQLIKDEKEKEKEKDESARRLV